MAQSASQLLTEREQIRLVALIDELLHVDSLSAFVDLMRNGVRELFPHDMLICGMGRISDSGTITDYRLLPIDFPMEYIREISSRDGGFISPIMMRWINTREPQLFAAAHPEATTPPEWLYVFQKYDLINVAAHGMHDLESNVTSYFAFCRLPGDIGERHSYLLRLLVPHLHAALSRWVAELPFAAPENPEHSFIVTERERDVIQWLLAGKTNWEIGKLLGISEMTARNHISKIFRKLNVSSRAQAVAKLSEIKTKIKVTPSVRDM